MIYGANGYTGHLVAAEAGRRGLNPVLAGRRAGPIEKLAAELDLPMRVFGLDDAPAAAAAIADMAVVTNCAGPFAVTSAPMIDACLTSGAHYLDITGEIDVFLAAQRRHADAQAAGIIRAWGLMSFLPIAWPRCSKSRCLTQDTSYSRSMPEDP